MRTGKGSQEEREKERDKAEAAGREPRGTNRTFLMGQTLPPVRWNTTKSVCVPRTMLSDTGERGSSGKRGSKRANG